MSYLGLSPLMKSSLKETSSLEPLGINFFGLSMHFPHQLGKRDGKINCIGRSKHFGTFWATLTLPISPDRKYLAKIPHAVKIYALILHICLLSSLTKYANVIGPPLLANAWIWPQEKGGNGTYLNKCFFSYCKNDSRHCKNDRRQSDYILFSTK